MAAKAKQKTKKPKSPPVAKKPRRLKQSAYRHFRLSKRIKAFGDPLPGVFGLLRSSLALIFSNKKLFIGIIAVQSILSLVFVSGLSSSFDFVQTKQDIEEFLGDGTSKFDTTTTLFGYLISSVGVRAGDIAGTYQLFFTLITSLAIIWSVRQVMAGEKVDARDAFYRGIYPMIPFLLVLFVVGLQLLPAAIGASIYSIVVAGGLAVTSLEKVLWLVFFILMCLLSIYMLISSLFALYIVTLPEMTPLKALRSARELVLHRRLSVGLRIVALPMLLLIVCLVLIAPAILFTPLLAIGLFLIFSSFCLCLAHTYMYNLYRSLL